MSKKVIQTIVSTVTEEPKTLWQKIKDWFYNSETVFIAWVYGIVGVVTTTVAGILSSTDFTSIFGMLQSGLSFTKQQLVIMGAGALGMGIVQYWARVRGTKEIDQHLLPKKTV